MESYSFHTPLLFQADQCRAFSCLLETSTCPSSCVELSVRMAPCLSHPSGGCVGRLGCRHSLICLTSSCCQGSMSLRHLWSNSFRSNGPRPRQVFARVGPVGCWPVLQPIDYLRRYKHSSRWGAAIPIHSDLPLHGSAKDLCKATCSCLPCRK